MAAVFFISLFTLIIMGRVEPKAVLLFGGLGTIALSLWWLLSSYQIYIVAR